ncbi:MAG: hypothetical protein SangKO_019650 [Sandaracinaceae bacterium]
MRLSQKLFIALSFTALAACGGRQEVEPAPVVQAEPPPPAEEPGVEDPDDVHLEGDHIVIDRHINFENRSAVILSSSDELLDHIAQLIANHPEEVTGLEIIGHTSSVGADAFNQTLSDERAEAVEGALRSRGVSIPLSHSGRGETELLCQEDTEECHSRNRRVEFLIVAPTAGGEA